MLDNNDTKATITKKAKKTIAQLKEEIVLQKQKAIKEANQRIKLLEKREKEQRLKPYFRLVEKHLDNITDKDLETMTNYIMTRFKSK